MNQKEEPNIDELLNSFLDGELTQRQHTEIQRLIAHDAQIAKRLRDLQKCKMLVGSLPFEQAPAEMAEQIKASLTRRTPLGQQPVHFDQRRGARHLLVRKVLTAAAMIGLVAILAAVIYTIVAPESVPDKSIVVKGRLEPAGKIKAESIEPTIVVAADKSIAEAGPAERGFSATLELKTNALAAVDAFINRAIEDNYISPERNPQAGIYAISCSRQGLNLLLADLSNIWARFDSATLFVETDQIAEQVVVDAVTAEQINEIVNQDSFKTSVKVAKDFAVLNRMAKHLPGKELLAAIDDTGPHFITIPIPKPRLTSAETTITEPRRQKDEEKLSLTIIVVGR